jgi:hypothetical protein
MIVSESSSCIIAGLFLTCAETAASIMAVLIHYFTG